MTELFELFLSGTAAERLYRRARPDVLDLPWKSGLGVKFTHDERAAARQQWTIAALQEYQSASAQAAVLAALVVARVPIDFSVMAAGFPADEIAHAEICARVAVALGGGAPTKYEPREVFAVPAPPGDRPLVHAAVLVAKLFGVGEGWSFGFLETLSKQSRSPLLRKVWSALVRDEARHARFAWIFLDWAHGELGAREWQEVRAGVRESIATLEKGWQSLATLAPESFSAISPLGSGDHEAYLARAKKALEKRVTAPFAKIGIDV
jgi:hypothetical protein